MTVCRCIWDCSHAWCGCPAGHAIRCVCGVRPRDCPVHLTPTPQPREWTPEDEARLGS